MQSWPNHSQDDGNGQDAWQSGFAFGDQGTTFDPNQQWAQPIPGQTTDFTHLHQDPAGFFDASPSSANPYLQAQSLHGSPTDQPAFQAQQYGQQGQDAIDPAFHNVHPSLYAHGTKPNAGANDSELDEGQAFAQHHYPFPPQGSATFHQQPQLVAQSQLQQHQASRQPEQYSTFAQTQHATVQPQRVVTPQGTYRQGSGLAQPPSGQPTQYPTDPHMNYPASRQQYQLQGEQINTQQPPRQGYQDGMHTFPGQPAAAAQNTMQHNAQYTTNTFSSVDPTGSAAKKRKRSTKSSDTSSETPLDSMAEATRKAEDMDFYPVPVPSAEDQEQLAKFSKRSKSAQVKYPAIVGLPHLVFDGSMKMPAPKSFDKLAPLVTLPPRSGKAMIPELGYSLPCEIQGNFTGQYRPAPDRAGLNERRMEAKDLLDQFEASMKAMGKRRPKYTEYPHAFKEQMKSDEAAKNKLGKKAKKELEGDNKPVRSAVRPTDPVEAASWDAVGIVHIDNAAARTSSSIAQRVQQAGDLFIKLRGEMNKAKQELDQATKDKKPEAEVAAIKTLYDQKKEAFYRALDSTVEHADDAVLDNLGGHQKLILSLVNALISCIKAADFSGKLPKIVLELISLFRMTRKIIDTTNFETVRKRFGDKGDADVKEIIQDINAKIKKVMKTSEPEAATGYTGTSAASRAKVGAKSSTDTTIKRSREDDSDSRTSKKIVLELPGSSLLKKLAQPKAQPQLVSRPAASSILPGKSRPAAKPIAKPEVVASAGSPVASGDEKPKIPVRKGSDSKSEPAKVPVPKPAPSVTSSALSGIASLLDSINAPKAEAAVPTINIKDAEVEDDAETPAAKAKRLRKLERRKMRVTWKPDHDLVQVRVFQKDDNEDDGRAMNMIRDAADDKSEGMMLKQRVGMDEDEDDDDVPYQPWIGPVPTDFSGLAADTRGKNFVTRGGTVAFSTEEQKRIAEREQRELMAIYTDPGDIPPTPKSPPVEFAKPTIDGKVGQLPSDDDKFAEIQRRWADEQQMGVDQALFAAVQRLDAKHSPTNKLDAILGRLQNSNAVSSANQALAPTAVQQTISVAASNVPLIVGLAAEEAILAWLRSDKIGAWRDPTPVQGDLSRPHRYADPSSQAAGEVIEAVAQYLQGKAYPANAPPDWMLQYEDKVKEWWFGYNKEAPARQRREDERRARAAVEAGPAAGAQRIQDWSYAQQQEYAPYMAILQQMNGGNPAAPAPPPPQQQANINDSQLQSILSVINQGPQQSNQPSSDAAYQMMMQMAQGQAAQQQPQQAAQQQAPQQAPQQASGGDRDWDRDDDRDQERGRGRDWDRDRNRTEGGREDAYRDSRKKKPTLAPHKPANKALIGTKACTFWQQGKCARGDQCTFRHD